MASNDSDPGRKRPLIGLTTYREQARCLVWETEFALLHASYVDAISEAGGIAVLLPPQAAGAEQLTGQLDGLLLTGGADISPERYGARAHDQTSGTRPGRDDWETSLLQEALTADLPVLGVCRGAQLLNVVLGGTIEQHLPDVAGHEEHRPGPGVFGEVRVDISPGSRIADLLRESPELKVQCHHHQAIARLAEGLEAAARAEDGTVEAVEMPGRSFVLGVQWHPEQDHAGDPRLFQALVTASRDTRKGAPE